MYSSEELEGMQIITFRNAGMPEDEKYVQILRLYLGEKLSY